MTDSAIPWIALALALFWSVGAYNRLVRLRSQAIAAFVVLDGRLSHYVALVDDNLEALRELSPAHLPVEPDAGPAIDRAGLLGACTQFQASLRVVRRQPLDAGAMAALHTAHAALQARWARVLEQEFVIQHPVAPTHQPSWAENSQLATHAIAEFNRAVLAHNAAITQFPALMLARLFGFRPAGCL